MGAPMRHQPQGRARLDLSNTIARALRFDSLVVGGNPINLASGQMGTVAGALSAVAGPFGVGFDTGASGSNSNALQLDPACGNITGPCTIIWWGRLNAPGGWDRLLSKDQSAAQGEWNIGPQANNAAAPAFYLDTTGSGYFNVAVVANGGLSQTVPEFLVVTLDGTNATLYRNGVVAASTPCSVFPGANNNPLRLGGGAGLSAAMNVLLAGTAQGALTAEQVKAFSANPWQIFAAGSSSSSYQAAIASTAGAGSGSATTIAAALASEGAAGQAAGVMLPDVVSASAAGMTGSGKTASVTLPTVIQAGAASASDGAQPATIVQPTAIAASEASADEGGHAAAVIQSTAIVASDATVSTAGMAAQVPSSTTIDASTATEASSGQVAGVTSGSGVQADQATESGVGLPASVIIPTVIAANDGGIAAGGLTADVGAVSQQLDPNPRRTYVPRPRNRMYVGQPRVRTL